MGAKVPADPLEFDSLPLANNLIALYKRMQSQQRPRG